MIATFRAMGGSGIIHLLSGPTPAAVSKQLMEEIIGPVQIAPFWALGFHLCRESDKRTTFLNTLDRMTRPPSIGFDSDCIDLRLSGPGSGAIDYQQFPMASRDRQLLKGKGKKFLLTQPPHVPDASGHDYKEVRDFRCGITGSNGCNWTIGRDLEIMMTVLACFLNLQG